VEVLEGRHQLAREEEGSVGVEPSLPGIVEKLINVLLPSLLSIKILIRYN